MTEQLPTPDELGATLDAALSADSQLSTDLGDEPTDLELIDDLAAGEPPGSEEGLQYLVKLVEQYPGLKVTLSFG